MWSIDVYQGVGCWIVCLTNPYIHNWSVLIGARGMKKDAVAFANLIRSDIKASEVVVH